MNENGTPYTLTDDGVTRWQALGPTTTDPVVDDLFHGRYPQ